MLQFISSNASGEKLVDRFFAGSTEDLVTALIEYRGLSSEESQRIRAMIERADKKQKGSNQREEK